MTALLVLLGALNLESLAVLLWAFFTPSESSQAVFLWLSRQRLFLVALLLVIWFALLAASMDLVRPKSHAGHLLGALDRSLVNKRRLTPALIFLILVPIVMAIAAVLILRAPQDYDSYRTWAPDTFPLLLSVVTVSLPLLVFLAAASLSFAVFLVLRYRRLLFTPSLWAWNVIAAPLLVLLMGLLTAFHWLVLAFQLRFFTNIPGWYWIFDPVSFGAGDLYYVLGALCLMGLAYWLLIIRSRVVVGLLMLVALGWFLQMGVGLMGGAGIATLRERFFTTYHAVYVEKASLGELGVLDGIRRYEEAYGSNTFTTTKPPGLMAFYVGLEHVVNGYPSSFDDATRYARLSDLTSWLFPLLAAGMVALLWAFARRLTLESSGLVERTAPILYVFAPSLALFTFFADQAVYPAIFLLGVWMVVRVIRSASLPGSMVLGALLYIAAFFSFTMLLLYPFAGLHLLLHNWKEHSEGRFGRVLITGLGIMAGTLIMYFLGRALLNYDFLSHFQRMASINHNFDFYLRVGLRPPTAPESLAARFGQIVRAAWINNLDFAAAIGFPIYILFVVQATRRIFSLRNPHLPAGDVVMLALLSSFVVLNLAGAAQGEIPRLWLFWLPMVVLLAAFELEPHLRVRPGLLLLLGGAQLITIMLTFHFQDLRM